MVSEANRIENLHNAKLDQLSMYEKSSQIKADAAPFSHRILRRYYVI